MQTKANLQDLFLLRARRDRVPVTMFLMNGFQMRGIITGFDAFVVILDSEGHLQACHFHHCPLPERGPDGGRSITPRFP